MVAQGFEKSTSTPVWIFGLLDFGWGGAVLTALPFVLRKAQVPVPRIAGVSAMLFLSAITYFLWTPVVDLRYRRRTWFLLLGIPSSLLAGAAFLQPLPSGLGAFSLLMLVSFVVALPTKGAVGALAAETVAAEARGRVSGWMQCGNLGGTALGGAAIVSFGERFSVPALSLLVVALALVPPVTVLFVAEPDRANGGSVRRPLGTFWRDLRAGLRSKNVREGLVLFLSPTGAGAASYLFSGIAVDYHASATTVAFVTGAAGSLLTAAGAVAGGYLSRRAGSELNYGAWGLASAGAALVMAIAPFVPASYAIGAAVYMAIAGGCWAAFGALALTLIGSGNRAGSTWYAFFSCLANAPIGYMLWLDGFGYKLSGPHGMLAVDAVFGAISSAAILMYFRNRSRAKNPVTQATSA